MSSRVSGECTEECARVAVFQFLVRIPSRKRLGMRDSVNILDYASTQSLWRVPTPKLVREADTIPYSRLASIFLFGRGPQRDPSILPSFGRIPTRNLKGVSGNVALSNTCLASRYSTRSYDANRHHTGDLRFTVTLPSTCPSLDVARREEWPETRFPSPDIQQFSRTSAPDQRRVRGLISGCFVLSYQVF
ncbi:hypothetical protein EV363DRAFT_1333228 [Boletus edulis]|nr:hypothetical protein EV363DRAFT_1333038 [Boletus edulis]KAF8130700.1 hypothetical protein EV363DRAFT_1333228 [Boletus edulis]